ncbi:MAG: ATP-binding protein [Cytophagales bacterium]
MQFCINLEQALIYLCVIIVYTTVLFYLVILKNRSKTDLINGQLKNAKVDLMKKNFVGNMSHEMRTPLNAIIGFSEQLLRSSLTAENKKYALNIQASSEHLIHIVNNLVMFSFPDEEYIISEKLPFSLSAAIKEISPVFIQKANEKGIQFFSHIENSQNDIVLGDAKLLRQILFNLFDNSIKFTLHGTVKSSFRLVNENNKVYLHAIISDTGIGISAEEINSIFNEFHQIDDKITRKFGGVGLGLSICKKLVEAQDGEIKVSSNMGIGTVFELKIPYVRPTSEQQKHLRNAAESAKILKNKHFLVVDDDEYNRLLASKRLELWGGNVVVCKNGTEAIIKLSQQKFDAILLDIHMPDISGIEVARIVRNQPTNINNATPILALTATVNNDEYRNVFDETGIDECLTKPYKENQLFEKLTMLLSKYQHFDNFSSLDIDQSSTFNVDLMPDENLYDLHELKSIIKDDDEFLLLMLQTFLKNGNENIVSLKKALAIADFKAVSEVAHKMLNSYRQLAINSVVWDLEQLEMLREIEKPDIDVVSESIKKITMVSNTVFIGIQNEILKVSIDKIE